MKNSLFSMLSVPKGKLFLPPYIRHFRRPQGFVFLVFLVLPYLFFALNVNILQFALAPGDGIVQGVPTKIYSARLELWNQYSQSGTFPLKDIGWQTSYLPGIIVMRLFPNPLGYNLLLLFHYSLAGFFTFLFLRRLGLVKIAAFIGGLSFMFSGFMTAHKGHHTMLMASAYLPIVLYLMESFLTTGRKDWLLLAAFAFGLGILADYAAVSMYIGMVLFPYIFFRVVTGIEFITESVLRKTLLTMTYSVVTFFAGMMLAAVEILPIVESLKYVTRQQISFEFFTSYSFSPKLLPLLIFPYIYGATSSSFYPTRYFGPGNLTELAGYMGILPLLFASFCFFLFKHKNRQVYFWTVVFIFAFLLVLGDSTPLYKLLYRVPVYNLFRAPARNWLEGNFAVAILASFFIHYMITDSTLQRRNYYRIASTVVIALIAVIFFIFAFGKFLIESPESLRLWSQNTRFASPAIYVPLIVITVSIILIRLLFPRRQNTNLWVLIGVFIFIDLFAFGHFHDTGYISYKIFGEQPNSVAEFLKATEADQKSFRIFPLSRQDSENQLYPSINLLYGLSTVNAYSPIWLKDYAALTGFGADGSVLKHQILTNSSVLSVLSTKYIVVKDRGDQDLIESILVNEQPDVEGSIQNGFNDRSWSINGSESRRNGIVTLQGSGSSNSILYSFAPRAKTMYKITFFARASKPHITNDVLAIDFYGINYDFLEQDMYIQPAELSSDFRKFTVYLYSGESPPASAFLRIFTFSKTPYEVKDVQLFPSGGPLYWGNQVLSGESFPLYQKKYESSAGIVIYENMNFLPRARFVSNLIPVSDSAAAVHALRHNNGINPKETALVEGLDFAYQLDDGQVINADYSEDSAVTLSVNSGDYSFLVLSDSWYPGWKAFIDGEETQIYRTNAVSRGVLIEGVGTHEIQFKFVPWSFYAGLGITIATILTIAIVMTYVNLSHSRETTDKSLDRWVNDQ